MAGNLRTFVDKAMAYCWDERHGYSQVNDGMGHPDFDCSGLICRCLYEAGFDFPSYHIGTMYLKSPLVAAGFQIYYPTSNSDLESVIKPGDIVVMNHLDWTGGHAFIYMEDVTAYTDYNADYDTTGIVHKVKIEASSSRGETASGDHRKNGYGAYWEVWVHAYWQLVVGYSFTSSNDEIYVAHYPGGMDNYKDLLLLKRIRDGQFDQDSWNNKFFDIGM